MKQYLDDLETRISPETEEAYYNDWVAFLEGRFTGDIFTPARRVKAPPRIEWPTLTVRRSVGSGKDMSLWNFAACSGALAGNSVMNIRANYGCGIMPSLFGCKLFESTDENTSSQTLPLEGGLLDVKKLISKGVPDLDAGLGGKVLEAGANFVELMQDYPKIRKYVHIYHPDLQGPFDACEMMLGCEMLLLLLDDPALAKDFLSLMTDTYIAFMKKWMGIVNAGGEYSAHWGFMMKGQVMLRNDSCMNLSPELYGEFAEPCDRRIIQTFGGGGIHFCGRGDHYIEQACAIPGVTCIQMAQPWCNDLEKIYRNTVDKGIKLLGLHYETAETSIKNGRSLHSNVQCSR